MPPDRLQRKRTSGWRMPAGAVCVTRPGRWGNPFHVVLLGRELAVSMFADLMRGFFDPFPLAHLTDAQFQDVHAAKEQWRKRLGWGAEMQAGARQELRGRDLVCWCPLTLPNGSRCPCHADILLEIANG